MTNVNITVRKTLFKQKSKSIYGQPAPKYQQVQEESINFG